MVLADEVNPVNQRYRELSSRYKAGWTFHRFLQGLRKFFHSEDLDDRTADFKSLYGSLREISLRLNDLDIPPVVEDLEEARQKLDGLIESLDQQDRKIAPSLVRLFFQRVKTQDERILIDLVRFYVEAQKGRDWIPERTDKVDYLLSRLGQTIADPEVGGDRERLNRVLRGLANYSTPAASIDPQKVANRMKLIEAVRKEVEQVDTFDTLTDRDLVAHYRKLKHGLGSLIFERSILPLVVSTNLVIAGRVTELTAKAQEKLFEDYEKVSGLEEKGLLGRDLEESVSRLHTQVGSFKKQVHEGTLRIDAIAEIQASVQEIFGRIEPVEAGQSAEDSTGSGALMVESVLHSAAERGLLGIVFQELEEALRETYRGPEKVSGLDSRLLEYQLGARELEAFVRLSDGVECEPELEQFLLAAVSLRRKIRLFVDELLTVGAESGAGSREGTIQAAKTCLRVGDLYLRRFDHLLEMHLIDQEAPTIRELQISKMHLTREYSGLWLLVHESLRTSET